MRSAVHFGGSGIKTSLVMKDFARTTFLCNLVLFFGRNSGRESRRLGILLWRRHADLYIYERHAAGGPVFPIPLVESRWKIAALRLLRYATWVSIIPNSGNHHSNPLTAFRPCHVHSLTPPCPGRQSNRCVPSTTPMCRYNGYLHYTFTVVSAKRVRDL